jgi:hypothetical protein
MSQVEQLDQLDSCRILLEISVSVEGNVICTIMHPDIVFRLGARATKTLVVKYAFLFYL